MFFNMSYLIDTLGIKKGEEIGMTDVDISWEETVDPQACNTDPTIYLEYSRDAARTRFNGMIH